ncbi:efflux transporter outer membrane subunit [Sphaerotilus uruguayifluvii]|uniref:NodT family efflux transporter outer membrane factor (OMF) lipoprotein n=1 Tax=Sphaerotilus uruguayifluvii TaxID=2735897 RepID=A0ABX2G1F8_9BURK|nr:NodT family efflux transporter outer membrane factor (OMF) lipoprotein [Leptothrix sp. C29]
MTVDMISNLISTNPRFLSRSSTLVAALVLAGCTSLAPRHERPAAPVPGELPLPASLAASAPARAASTAWPDFLTSPQLQQLVKLSLERNRDLRVAVLNVQRAQAQLGVTRADRLPTVGVGLSNAASPNASTGQQVHTYTAGVQLSAWEVDLFGRIANLGEAAQAQVLASEAGRRSAELSLVAGVASGWLALAADTELLETTRRIADSREASMKLAQLRFDKGAASSVELQSARTLLEQARASRAQLQRQRDQDLNALTLLAGGPVPAELLPGATASASAGAMLAPVPVGLSSEVLLQRPDVIQAEQQLAAANANIGVARAAFFPRLTLTASAGQASTSLSDLFSAGHFAWTMSTQLLATVFDAGRNKANLDSAKISRDIAVAQYEKSVQSAFRETADALAGLDTWRDQLAAQQVQLDAARETARLAELRYQNGAASELERLDAQRSLLATEQALVQTRLGEQLNRVTLWKVLGG